MRNGAKIIERGSKKKRGRRNSIDSLSLPLSSPSMKLFSADWRRWRCCHFLALWTAKKLWSWTKRASLATLGWAEPKPETYLENYIRKRFSSSLLSHRLIYALPQCFNVSFLLFQCFFSSFNSFSSLSLLAFEEKWNLEAGPSSFRLDLNVGIFSGPFNRASFIFTFLPLSRNYSKYLKLVERFSWSTVQRRERRRRMEFLFLLKFE